MRKYRNFIIGHEFYCTRCGQKGIDIIRQVGKEREKGHLKRLFCLKCQDTINHVECVPYSNYDYQNFLEEFLGGNFDEQGNRKQPYGIFKDELHKNKKWDDLERTVIDYMLEEVD